MQFLDLSNFMSVLSFTQVALFSRLAQDEQQNCKEKLWGGGEALGGGRGVPPVRGLLAAGEAIDLWLREKRKGGADATGVVEA